MIYQLILLACLVYAVYCYATVARAYYGLPPGVLVSAQDHVVAVVVMLLAPITLPLAYVVARYKERK